MFADVDFRTCSGRRQRLYGAGAAQARVGSPTLKKPCGWRS